MEENADVSRERRTYLFNLLTRFDHYIGTTNFKLGLTFSFIATISIALYARSISVFEDPCSTIGFKIPLLVAVISTTYYAWCSIKILFKVVAPDTRTDEECNSFVFFGDVAKKNRDASDLARRIKLSTDEDLERDLINQLYSVASVASAKFDLMSEAISMIVKRFLPSVILTLLVIVLAAIF